jgi:predicted Zn-dependent protease
MNYKNTSCSCNGSAIRPGTARHELGHALGYYHTDSATDLMSGLPVSRCDASPSPREQQAIAYHYR